MSREIRFRAWDTFEKTMWNVSAINFFGKTVDLYRVVFNEDLGQNEKISNYDMPFTNRIILMEFTGLKDKNKKETYSGDKLKDATGAIGVIYWKEIVAGFYCKWEDGSDLPLNTFVAVDKCEIVGTIHDTPEEKPNE